MKMNRISACVLLENGLKQTYICKHIISLAVHLKYIDYPSLDLNIEGNRKRGKPAKAKSALVRDDNC